MSNPKWPVFASALAPVLTGLMAEQQALGYHPKEAQDFARFDRFCQAVGHDSMTLPRQLVEQWTMTQPGETETNHQRRITLMRVLAGYMQRGELSAWTYPRHATSRTQARYVPYIFTREELAVFLRAVDRCPSDPRSPDRGVVLSLLFRILYGSGLRVSEALHLQRRDVDGDAGTLYIRHAKGHKERRIPLHPALMERMTHYLAASTTVSSAPLFPNGSGSPYAVQTVYGYFRRFLAEAGIDHGGRGQGPRLHDLSYPNLNKIPTFFENPVRAAFCTPKGWDFFFTVSVGSHHRMPLGSRFHFSIAWIPLGPPRLPRWPRLFVLVRG